MKKMKRAATAALTIGMLISSAPYAALADAPQATAGTLTQEQAIEAAKKYIKLPDGYQFRNASLQEQKGDFSPFGRSSIWIINFSSPNQSAFGEINVVIDAKTAKLLDLNVFQRDDAPIENAISREEAKAKAIEYLKQFDADKVDQVQEMTDAKYPGPYGPQAVMHSFRFVRMVNGIPYPMDGINVTVDGKGELRNYRYNWTENVQFPQPNAPVTEQQAREAFRNALNLQLQYIVKRKPYKDMPDEAQLVYGPWGQYGLPMIDATKGVAIDRNGKPLAAGQTSDWKPLADQPGVQKQNPPYFISK